MKTFLYRAKKGPEDIIEGKMQATSTEEVVERLSRQGYIATSVAEEAAAAPESRLRMRHFFGISLKERIAFSKQLASLIRSGVSMLRALNVLSRQTTDPFFRSILKSAAEKVQNGQPFSDCLKAYPKIFSDFYVAMIKSGEDSGTLSQSLERIHSYYFKQYQFVSKLRSAMAYPLLILIVGFLTVFFMLTNVMPRIIPLLLNLDIELPLTTKILINLSMFFKHNWLWIILGVLIFTLILMRAMKNKNFQRAFSAFKLSVPFFGNLLVKAELARFTRALEVALRSGIPIITALNIALPILKEGDIRDRLESSKELLEKGESLNNAFGTAEIFPPFALNIIGIGEEAGSLIESLGEVAQSFEADCEEFLQVVISLLEPIMVLGIGLLVGFIVSAVLSPIFRLSFVSV